jgi:hypothetical protein
MLRAVTERQVSGWVQVGLPVRPPTAAIALGR